MDPAVGQHERALGVRCHRDLGYRRNSASDVRLVGDGDELGPAVDQLADVAQVHPAVRRDAEPAQRGTGTLAQLLPGNEVRVVLELGDQDLVARANREPAGLRP